MRTRANAIITGLALLLTACNGGNNNESGAGTGDGNSNAPASDRHFGFVSNGVAAFWVIGEKGANDAADELGVKVDVLMPAGGVVDQKRMLEDLLAKEVDGIAVSPIDPDNQTDMLNMIAGRTTLITHDSDAPQSDRLCYIGMDNYAAGRMAGELVKEALPEGGDVFIFIGRLEQDNAKRRRQGCIDELLDRSHDPTRYDPPDSGPLVGDKYTILGTFTDQFDRAKAKANAEDALSRHPDLDCMVGLFAYNPPLCLAALDQAGKLGDVTIIGFDENEETLQGIIDGTVYGTVVQDPYNYGYRSVQVLNALASGDTSVIPESGVIDIPARKIKAAEVESFWADLRAKLGQAP